MSVARDSEAEARFLDALRVGGVVCSDDPENDWVDDLASRIREALLGAGWKEPTS